MKELSKVKTVKALARSIMTRRASLTGKIKTAAVAGAKTVKARKSQMKNKVFTPTMSAECGPSMKKRQLKTKLKLQKLRLASASQSPIWTGTVSVL